MGKAYLGLFIWGARAVPTEKGRIFLPWKREWDGNMGSHLVAGTG